MADTTATTGRCAAVERTMAAARAMQFASPTEVPPNFMTWREFDIVLHSIFAQARSIPGKPMRSRVTRCLLRDQFEDRVIPCYRPERFRWRSRRNGEEFFDGAGVPVE